ncbi:MAG: exonuclease domain-containing protein [Bifidobacterium psychraerophilum]|uniref:exonuclease domain-containing protein n=1 Tax=Bifidobacterium psychraerophilum TaxID=218140 RepID=UPI0039ECFD74
MTDTHRILEGIEQAGTQDQETLLSQSWLLGFDTETTGAAPGADAIVSATLVLRNPQTGYKGDTIAEWLINPHRHISAGASRVNGFTDDFVQGNGVEPQDALTEISDVIIQAQRHAIPLLAYNAPFDVQMLLGDLRRWDCTQSEELSESDMLIVDPLVIDRSVSHRSGKRTLSFTTEYYGVEAHGDFHDATADTIAAVDLVKPMTTLYPQVGRLTLAELMPWQREAHRVWKESFNRWLESKGRRPIHEGWFE